jgi:hypothetical protein
MLGQPVRQKIVALVVIFGVPVLLFLGLVYNIVSPREWAIGLLAWFAALLLWVIVGKRAAKKTLKSGAEPTIALDDDTRRRILRGIWTEKVWIGMLAVSLPFGIANGMAHRAWLPTLGGVGINLSLMYLAIQQIKQRRKRLKLTRQ